MAKKQKRAVSGVAKNNPVQSPSSIAASADKKSSTTFSSSRLMSASEFNPDYSYVIKDLKRIGVLAGTFFAAIVVLSLFLK
ncbi:MAG: hypothetical protein HPY45_02095 [Anaerolineae bacterium]|nr:hypothetical protein [Anaerolineae bacterium]